MEFLLTWQWWAATLAGAFIGSALVVGGIYVMYRVARRLSA